MSTIFYRVATYALLGLVVSLLVGGASFFDSAEETEAVRPTALTFPQSFGVRADTGTVKAALRHFYRLYTSRNFDALYAQAAPSLRTGGMKKADFRRFMRKKRSRLGPVQSVTIEVPRISPTTGRVSAIATVTYAQGRRVERWRLSVRGDTVRWRSFRTTNSSGGGATRKEASGERPKGDGQMGVGTTVPSFEADALRDSARTFTPSDFEGQYLLLNFWATWCAPCLEKIPTLRSAARRYKDRLAILNLSFDYTRLDVTSFLNRHDVPGHHAFVGLDGLQGSLANRFEIDGIPNPILVGPNGQVVATERHIQRAGLLRVLDRTIGGG